MTDTTPVAIITYILKNNRDKYYCGKTNNLSRRMKEHSKDRWKGYNLIWSINGDHEKKIKIFGVKRFYNCITTGVVS